MWTLESCGTGSGQDSLLVKRRNDNHSPGPVIRELVPSSHQRSEHMKGWCFHGIYEGGLWKDDLYVSAQV